MKSFRNDRIFEKKKETMFSGILGILKILNVDIWDV